MRQNPENPVILNGVVNPYALAIVHATHYKPSTNTDGSVSLYSAYANGNEVHLRHTLHYALNHKVSGHGQTGQSEYDSRPYAVIASFMGAVQKNGSPAMITPSDTFWPTNARDPMILPDAMIIVPDESGLAQSLVTFNEHKTIYKISSFTPEDETILADYRTQEKLRLAQTADERDAILAVRAQEYATHEAIKYKGFEIELANQWGWIRSDYNYKQFEPLAEALHTKSGIPHMHTDYYRLSVVMQDIMGFVDYHEALAGNGNIIKHEETGLKNASIYNPQGIRKCCLSSYVAELYADSDKIQEKLADNLFIANQLDENTRDVVRDFTQKVIARIETAKRVRSRISVPSTITANLDFV